MSRTHRKTEVIPTCGPTGKIRYRTRNAARDALNSTKRAAVIEGDADRKECRIYPCKLCGGFHLTSQPFEGRVSLGERL